MTGLEFILGARAFAGERAPANKGPLATLSFGRRIVNRRAVGADGDDPPFTAGEAIYAHTTIAGHGAGFIEHVWWRDGVEVAHHYMPVGADCRWRAWSRHRLEAGRYVVEVLAPDGACLANKTFTAS